MILLLGALASIGFGQVVGFSETIPPDNELPIRIVMQDGTSFVAYPPSNWQSARNINPRLDAPWDGNKAVPIDVGNVDRANSLRERASEWRQRHETNWKERGYVDLDETEAYYWVPKSEIELAARAREMSAVAPEIVSALPLTASEDAQTDSTAAGPNRPGFLSLWGPHIAVVAAALVLSGAAVWFFLRGQ
jgi:hypothetical protein